MINVENVVIEVVDRLLKEAGKQVNVNGDLRFLRENGIDSLMLISMILEIEESLEIDLDEYLAELRKSRHLIDFIEVVKSCYKTQHE